MKKRIWIISIALFLLSFLTIIYTRGQSSLGGDTQDIFPTKTIKINMSWPPGGSSDTQARVLIENAKEVFGVPVLIVDKSGAAGTKSAMATKTAKPDGYTIMWASGGQFTLTPLNIDVAYAIGDFKSILGTTLEHTLVVTAKDSGITSLEDLKNRGTITYGSPGASSGPAAAIGMLMSLLGVEAEHVPFAGSNESSTAALGGHVDIADSRTTIAESMADLRVLCILSSKRSKLLPNIPTAKELGYDVVLESYNGLYAPKDTPDDIVQVLRDGFTQLLEAPQFQDFVQNSKIDVYGISGKALSEKIKNESRFFQGYFGG